jgi:hypothetical protein
VNENDLQALISTLLTAEFERYQALLRDHLRLLRENAKLRAEIAARDEG